MSTGSLGAEIETYQRLLKVLLDLVTEDMRPLSVVCSDLCSDRNQDEVTVYDAGRSSRTRNAGQATSWLNRLLDFCENRFWVTTYCTDSGMGLDLVLLIIGRHG